eukprot:TRINITY_DN985_c0_g1_i1.p4 TRINITY_DN985_c0_g1~~TRINITY_DN985_c0_g1_i1.p4  ORF type:complete len:127 (-),score=48.33 TRINITY_DN985_c0_g1_i1:248-628(-)
MFKYTIALLVALVAAVAGAKCPCNDSAPEGDASYTCVEQKDFGKCGEAFMSGYCECVCGVCEYQEEEMMMGGEMMMAPMAEAPQLSKKEQKAANKAAKAAKKAAKAAKQAAKAAKQAAAATPTTEA